MNNKVVTKEFVTKPKTWMLYGAYGVQGQLILHEALAQGERPLLAGRSIAKLRPLAERYGLPWRMLDLQDDSVLAEGLADVSLVLNAAGPYYQTAQPLLKACLISRSHYVDLNAEIPTMQQLWRYQAQAQASGITAVLGCGLEVAPVDCLLMYLMQAHPTIASLEVAIDVNPQLGVGLWLDGITLGGRLRRNHKLIDEPFGRNLKSFAFSRGVKSVISYPSAALEICYRWSHIPNMKTYMTQTGALTWLLKWVASAPKVLLQQDSIRHFLQKYFLSHKLSKNHFADRFKDPIRSGEISGRTLIWMVGKDYDGQVFEAGLETLAEPKLTAVIAMRTAQLLLAESFLRGVYSPAEVFGAEFIMQVPTTIRFSSLTTTPVAIGF